MNNPTTQPWEIEFDEKFKCINSDCDQNGSIPHQVSDDEWEAQQCQFCFEYRFPIKSFITSTRLSAYKEGKKDALKKVLESLPEDEETSLSKLPENIDVVDIGQRHGWDDYRLAAREIIKKLIEE